MPHARERKRNNRKWFARRNARIEIGVRGKTFLFLSISSFYSLFSLHEELCGTLKVISSSATKSVREVIEEGNAYERIQMRI
jgi:hypothetical protein